MKNKATKFFFFLLSFTALWGCHKNQWKEPAGLQMMANINQEPSPDGKIQFSGGFIKLEEIQFDGKRSQGDDVYFSIPYDNLTVNFGLDTIPELEFDVPQGSYTYVRFLISTSDQNNLTVEGTYLKNSELLPLVVQLDLPTHFNIIAKRASGGSDKIIMNANSKYGTSLNIDPLYWFGSVSNGMLDAADLTNVAGTPTLLISKDVNTLIFDKISDRIEDSAEILVD